MRWDAEWREGIDHALNEADVLGLRPAVDHAAVDVLLHVLAMPEDGPLGPDRRRILRLHDPGTVDVVLRLHRLEGLDREPAIPLAGLDAVEAFFASLSWGGSIYGWRFLDDPELTTGWPPSPSLRVDLRATPAAHTFYWFNECGDGDGDDTRGYCIEGTVSFNDLSVHRADGSEQDLGEFVADSRRYWTALQTGDPRLAFDAQRAAQAGTPSWRPWAGGWTATTVSGT
ncbi:hypothetical protein [Jiangella mangrovi]|uniref:Uncharacterized protein n=1 Tax=Jiangella mangrovi TaxID=1524084 RepID=A0A7W9GS05_9ACTN|nr:hypothetical protein [Jiangella mangrovi]MBB5788857.1 hypothetical protein [Jiangella mangrovi]